MSNVGAWTDHHGTITQPLPYGTDDSYQTVADFMLLDRTVTPWMVEDWGCGGGGLRRFIPGLRYRGIDGSASPYADETVDLTEYRSTGYDVVLRHVLEHNDDWPEVLRNACRSFHTRLCVVLFTPLAPSTFVMFREAAYGDVPVISFRLDDVLDIIAPYADTIGAQVTWRTDDSPGTAYGVETFIFVAR